MIIANVLVSAAGRPALFMARIENTYKAMCRRKTVGFTMLVYVTCSANIVSTTATRARWMRNQYFHTGWWIFPWRLVLNQVTYTVTSCHRTTGDPLSMLLWILPPQIKNSLNKFLCTTLLGFRCAASQGNAICRGRCHLAAWPSSTLSREPCNTGNSSPINTNVSQKDKHKISTRLCNPLGTHNYIGDSREKSTTWMRYLMRSVIATDHEISYHHRVPPKFPEEYRAKNMDTNITMHLEMIRLEILFKLGTPWGILIYIFTMSLT